MKMRRLFATFLACALFAAPWAQALSVGNPAPAPYINSWIKHPQTQIFDSAHVTVIEVWATWCGACYYAIPEMTQLQAQYKDTVRVVAISDESADLLTSFVAAQGSRMDYPVACGVASAYGIGYIPYCTIVDQTGHVFWKGFVDDLPGKLAEAVNKGVFISNDISGGFVDEGEDIAFTITLAHASPVTYAWTKNGVPIGGNSPTLTLPHVTPADDGAYSCTVTSVGAPGIFQRRGTFLKVVPEGATLPATSPLAIAALVGALSVGGASILTRKPNKARNR